MVFELRPVRAVAAALPIVLAALLALEATSDAQAQTPPAPPPLRTHRIIIPVWRDGIRLPDPAPAPSPEVRADSAAPAGDWLDQLLAQYDWPLWQARAVVICESKGNPNALSYAGAVGLFQIHPYNPANFDPATNVAAAYRKYLDGVRHGNPWMHWNRWGGCGHF